MKTKIIIRDLKDMEKVSKEWIDAFEEYIPKWVESLVPHYEVAKEYNVDVLELSNTMYLGDTPPEIIKNGIHYYLHEKSVLGRTLSFNGNSGYYPVNWKEGFEKDYKELENRSDIERINDWMYYSNHLCRYNNRKEPYDELAKRIEAYFRELVGNETVLFDLGSTSYILLDPSKKWHINHYKKLET